MSSLTSSRKEKRLSQYVTSEISERAYNLTMGGTVFYGLILNIIMCALFGDMTAGINPVIFLLAYFVCCIAGIAMSTKSNHPLVSFLGCNLVVVPVGMVLSSCITEAGGLSSDIIIQAFAITTGISTVMILLSIAYPSFFSKLGGILLASLFGLIIVEIVFLLLRIPQIATAWFGAVLFSLYIGYDFWKAQQYPRTIDNAIDCAMDIYLDVINLFLKILRILGSKKD